MAVAAMGRVERAAEQADPAPAPVAQRRRQIEQGGAQGRTCPVPRTRYL